MSENAIDSRKQNIIDNSLNTDFLSTMPTDEIELKGRKQIPIAQIATLGIAFQPLVTAFQNVCGLPGGSGLYYVNAKGGTLVHRADESAYIGSLSKGNNQIGGGTADLTPLSFTPEMVSQCCMAVSMLAIEEQLSKIQRTQEEILEFVEEKDKYMLKGSLYFLLDMLSNYKYNCENKEYKQINHIKILDVKESAEQSILLYSSRIQKITDDKSFLHIDSTVKDKLKTLQTYFKSYQIALYNYAFSSYLDVILLGNFDSEFLESIINKIDKYSIQFRETYTIAYEKIDAYIDSSLNTLALKSAGSVTSKLGENLEKNKRLSKIGDKVTGTSKELMQLVSSRKDEKMEQIISNRTNYTLPFKEAIEYIKKIYNTEFEVVIGNDSIYINEQIA